MPEEIKEQEQAMTPETRELIARHFTPPEQTEQHDNVSHPAHYTQGGIECIAAIKASMTPVEFQGYCKGNCEKYLWRWRNKGGAEDLKKAKVYLGWLLDSVLEETGK